MGGRSSAAKAHESALSGLDESSVQPGPRQIELGHRLAVDLDRSLGDQTARLAGRADAEVIGQQGRQMERVARRELGLGHVLRRLMLAHDAGEMLLGPRRGSGAV